MTAALDHVWRTASRHDTSDGAVAYQRCHCGTWRIRLDPGRADDPDEDAHGGPVNRPHTVAHAPRRPGATV